MRRRITDFTLRGFFHPVAISRFRRFLSRAESFSAGQLRGYQEARLREMVEYAYRHVPYYRETFDRIGLRPADIRGLEDLGHLPPLTKETVRERGAELVSDELPHLGAREVLTSGSTGTPLRFYADRHLAAAKFALFWRVWNWAGWRARQRWAVIGGAVFEDGRLVRRHRTLNALYISSFNLTAETTRSILGKLRRFRPAMLRGYPSSLCIFARLAGSAAALRDIGIRTISTNSETLLAHQRAYLEETFQCPVRDVYSQWEQVCVAAECERGTLHHQAEYGVLELLDPEGRPVRGTGTGEIVATGLFNRAMPFLRYRTGDLASRGLEPCACGRAHPALERVDGRIEDVVITPDGRHVGRLDPAFKEAEGFSLAQVVQDADDHITVFLVPDGKFSDGTLQGLERALRDRVGSALRIDFRPVPHIDPGPNGKIRFVVNRTRRNKSARQQEGP